MYFLWKFHKKATEQLGYFQDKLQIFIFIFGLNNFILEENKNIYGNVFIP